MVNVKKYTHCPRCNGTDIEQTDEYLNCMTCGKFSITDLQYLENNKIDGDQLLSNDEKYAIFKSIGFQPGKDDHIFD